MESTATGKKQARKKRNRDQRKNKQAAAAQQETITNPEQDREKQEVVTDSLTEQAVLQIVEEEKEVCDNQIAVKSGISASSE